MVEYRVTNIVLKSVLATGTPLDLPSLANVLTNVVYDPHQFSALRLRSKKIGGSMLLFANGYAVCVTVRPPTASRPAGVFAATPAWFKKPATPI